MSNDKSVMSIGLAHQLDMAFVRNGWNATEINILSQGDTLKYVREVMVNRADFNVAPRVIDCDVEPFRPPHQFIYGHQRDGKVIWDPYKISSLIFESEKAECYIAEHREGLNGRTIFNACLLDYLLKHQDLIPEEWKGRCIRFWGTVYQGPLWRTSLEEGPSVESVRALEWNTDSNEWVGVMLRIRWFGN